MEQKRTNTDKITTDKSMSSPQSLRKNDKEAKSLTGKNAKATGNEGQPAETKEEEEKRQTAEAYKLKTKYFASNLIELIIPISLTMLMVVGVQMLVKTRFDKPLGFILAPYTTPTGLGEATINAFCILAAIIVMTFLVVLCVYCDAAWCLYGILVFTLFSIVFMLSWKLCLSVVKVNNITLDWISVMFTLYNYGVVGMISLFWKSPVILKQFYTCINCATIAIVYIESMDTYTVWVLLAVLVLWDIFAVLTPCGPLNILVQLLRKKGHLSKIPPGLVYSTMVYLMAEKKNTKSSKDKMAKDAKKVAEEEESDEEDDHGVHLGLGDFIFYSLLIGKAADPSMSLDATDWNTIIACYTAVLIGLISTVIILLVCERAAPALPISLTLGLIFYFLTSIIITSFCNVLTMQSAFI